MLRNAFVLSLLSALAMAAGPNRWNETTERVDRYAADMSVLGRFNGAVLVARRGQVFEKAYGYADFASHSPMTVQTQFEIASLTKMFTAIAILKLRDRGALRLEDSICRYVQPCPAAWQPVTIDEILHHRSGIPDYENALDIESPAYYAFMTQPESSKRILQREAALPLDFPPGSRFSYSNSGYVALGFAIEAAAHEPYARFLHEAVLDPAGLTSTGILGVDRAPRLAKGYEPPDVSWAQRLAGFSIASADPKEVPKLSLTPPSGDAGLFSTIGDMYRWTQIMMGVGPKVVNAAERAEVFHAIDGYGDGWMIGSQFGLQRYRHTGELPGFLSNVSVYPAEGITTIVMSNVDTPMMAFTRDVQAIALGQPYDEPYSGALVSLGDKAFSALFGEYAMADGDSLCVTRDAHGMLEAKIKDKFVAGLLPMSATRFYMPLSSGVVTFDLRSGHAKSVNMRYNGVDHIGIASATSHCAASS
jgi:CubicO group peptidase (beta-lactamase class C family)